MASRSSRRGAGFGGALRLLALLMVVVGGAAVVTSWARAAIPPLSYAEIFARSTVLARVGADGLVAESFKGGLAVGSKPPPESLAGTAVPAMIGRTAGGWYASTIAPTGLVALHPPGREHRPRPVTLAQIRGLAKTGVLPPYVVRATLRWPKSPVTRELVVTWNGDRSDGPLTVEGLVPPVPAETYGSVDEKRAHLTFGAPRGSVHLKLDVTSSEGEAILGTLAGTNPPTASAKELDALLAK